MAQHRDYRGMCSAETLETSVYFAVVEQSVIYI